MGAIELTSRAIIGEFFMRLEQDLGAGWIPGLSTEPFKSNQEAETYKWLGMSPAMREWIGGRQPKGLRANGITITNKLFEATMEVLVQQEIKRDKTGQVLIRVAEMAQRANAHWASLLSTLMLNGAAATCYDGHYFFDTAHAEGDSGTQSNKLSIDISELACGVHGSITAPSAQEIQQCILQAIAAILGFKDDTGEPMNENAQRFLVMVPISLYNAANAAVNAGAFVGSVPNIIQSPANKFAIDVAPNARLGSWTSTFSVYRTDGMVKPFIRQEEAPLEMDAIAEGSELEFKEGKWWFGTKASRNVGYGYWQHAVQVIMG